MTVGTTPSRVRYAGDGTTTDFPVPFAFIDAGDLQVIARQAGDGSEAVLVLDSDFTVSGGGGAGGTVHAAAAPSAAVEWVIRRATARTQETDYTANDPFPAETHERALDRLTMIAQEQDEALGRVPTLPVSSSLTALVLPEPAAGRLLAWNAAADGLANMTAADLELAAMTPFAAGLLDDADAEAARATLGAQAALAVVPQPEAEAGAATVERLWTAQRVAQAIAALSAGTPPTLQVFTTSGTWTKPVGLRAALVFATGGGGGGGGSGTTANRGGAGGGAGATHISLLAAASLGSTEAVTIGAGGAAGFAGGAGGDGGSTSFGALVGMAGGGTGGLVGSTPGNGGSGASPGAGAELNIAGGSGDCPDSSAAKGGTGGASFWGGAGTGATANGTGGDGRAYGTGGGGGATTDTIGSAGGSGAAGVVLVLEIM